MNNINCVYTSSLNFLALVLKWPFDMESSVYAILVPGIIYPINNIMFTASVYTTVAVSYERCVASFYPLKPITHVRFV